MIKVTELPIKIGDKTFSQFKDAEAHIKKTKPGISDPAAYVASIEQKQEGIELKKDPRVDTPVLDDQGQPNIIDYSNQEPMLFGLGENSSHDYPGKIVINNESRYVDREVKRSTIPNAAESGKHSIALTEPTLPTGAPDHNKHGYNFNTKIDFKNYDDPSKHEFLSEGPGYDECQHCGAPRSEHMANEAVSIPAGLVDREIAGEYSYKEMKEALIKEDIRKLMEAVWQEQMHPRDEEGKFTSKEGGQTTKEKKKPHLPFDPHFKPEPIELSSTPAKTHEDTAFKISELYPDIPKEKLVQEAWKADIVRKNHETKILDFANSIQNKFNDADITYRVKTRSSMLEKIARKRHYNSVDDLQDISGMRPIVGTSKQVKDMISEIKKNYKVVTEDNYIDNPKGGYRSYHLVVELAPGVQTEIQARTYDQDKWANWMHNYYKPPTKELKEFLKRNRKIVDDYGNAMSDYLDKKEKGMDAEKPECPEELKLYEGCLDL